MHRIVNYNLVPNHSDVLLYPPPHSTAVIPPPEGVVYQPYEEVARTIRTGDLLLFSSVKTTTSLIKLFDHAMFGHVGIVSAVHTCAHMPIKNNTPICSHMYMLHIDML